MVCSSRVYGFSSGVTTVRPPAAKTNRSKNSFVSSDGPQLNSVRKKWHEHIHEWVQNLNSKSFNDFYWYLDLFLIVSTHFFFLLISMMCLCALCFYPVFLFSAVNKFPFSDKLSD